MGRIKKRGTSGNAKNFITRTRAIRKLQVSLADFRRLCIFKGIYPREPRNKKKANKGSTAPVTFYYSKDIQYLMHEPILQKFREHKTFSKKLTKALGKGEVGDAKRLEENRPRYKLDRVIKERYPSFLDALRDLDDGLNMLFLFSNMRATNSVNAKVISQASKLTNQWMAYVARERSLKKVFVSIKGVYYSATVKGQEIIWLVPFKFPQNIPSDIDFRIMLTFLEFYTTLLHFVLYRLYSEAGLVYPPRIDESRLKGIGGLSAYVLETRGEGNRLLPEVEINEEVEEEGPKLSKEEISKAIDADEKEEDVDGGDEADDAEEEEKKESKLDEFTDENKIKGDVLAQPSEFDNPTGSLFSKFSFYIGREVPIDVLEFVILAGGGKVISEAALDELALNGESEPKIDLSSVTHQIVDRPKVSSKVQGRTYVQPQWVFDCINRGSLLSVSDYAPGETLPPHLSPWGDSGTYNPSEPARLGKEEEEEEEQEEEEEVEEEEKEGEESPEEEVENDDDLKAQKELEMEAAGVKYSDVSKKDEKQQRKKRKAPEVDEEKELKMIMMTRKQRSLYKKMQYGLKKEETRTEELQKKKRKLEKTKAKVAKLDEKKKQ
ncbi:DEKNAAC102403 [Brettanomyces naardenensis]|uniref:Pescadillo homolog n=1 Tax=Brettanomyces naardenensis TaxID=13370 RepID=A0A448YKC9_BRENA|nr:DEKNAAC102403 [Brettanomyces naardenensis]